MNRFLKIGKLGRKAKPEAPAGRRPGTALREDEAASKLGLLRASDLFHDLGEEQMTRVETLTVMARCERGRLIYSPGDTGEALFLLKRGRIHIYRVTPDGRKLITAVVEEGTLFGNMAFTGSTLGDSFAEALEASILCVMSRHDIERLIVEFPSVGLRLLDTLSRRMQELEARLEEGLLRDMRSRVAAALLRLRERHASDQITITHQELADSLGTYRETVTNTLGELQSLGCISLRRGCIEVRDPGALGGLVSHGSIG